MNWREVASVPLRHVDVRASLQMGEPGWRWLNFASNRLRDRPWTRKNSLRYDM